MVCVSAFLVKLLFYPLWLADANRTGGPVSLVCDLSGPIHT
jgi:hypothetical protein